MEDTDWFAELRTEEAKHQRCFWRRVGALVFTLLLVAIAAALLLYPKKAHAGLVARNGGDWVRLHESPCTNAAILDRLKAEYQARFRKGEGFISGKPYAMCWTPLQDESVFMIWEDGELGRVPMIAFEKDQ